MSEVLTPTPEQPEVLWTVAEAAQCIKSSKRFVYDHFKELGGVRIGGTKKRAGLLRFVPHRVRRYISKRLAVT
jgi:hypothetical protein